MTAPVAVLGAGAWGTALAIALARNGAAVRLWARRPEHALELEALRCNRRYLPDLVLPPDVGAHGALADAVEPAAAVLCAVPTAALRETLTALRPLLGTRELAGASKGLERDTLQRPAQIAAAVLGADAPWAAISGPSFAGELALGLPTALRVAAADRAHAQRWARRLHGGALRAYPGSDVVGVELAGALKNVLAIAIGISDALGQGANARAALVTRGLAELARLGRALGGQAETFQGLAGLGDLVLTATDDQSRNRRVGLALGAGQTLAQALATLGQVAEGVYTAPAAVALATRHGVELPICAAVAAVLDGTLAPREAVRALLAREMRAE
jgi:glycerol-3-phosphate dehydrogenase (NAD(P)+)